IVVSGDSSFLFVNESISENNTSTTTGKSPPDGIEPTTNETSTTTETIPSFFATKKPESLVGWLQNPKREVSTTTHNPIDNNLVKDGFCGNKHDYGIRCGKRMDQCKKDSNCPGVTKCCLVSDCGFLCVRPKAKRKQKTKKKKKEPVTTAEGLKVEDITKMPEKKPNEEEHSTGIPDVETGSSTSKQVKEVKENPQISEGGDEPSVTKEIKEVVNKEGMSISEYEGNEQPRIRKRVIYNIEEIRISEYEENEQPRIRK
ncbi:hypothetical protein Anas_12996, partial [Armadillidium nasatum]